MSYDSACYRLAEEFLSEYQNLPSRRIGELAQRIQDTIEDFCVEVESNGDNPDARKAGA
jgi:hypothetical protein